jgi:hypothetical protein
MNYRYVNIYSTVKGSIQDQYVDKFHHEANIQGEKYFHVVFICPEAWARICKRLQSSGIDSMESICRICSTGPPGYIGRRNSIPWNRFLGSLNVYKFGLWRNM